MASSNCSYGRIRLFNEFAGPEIPVANAVAYGTTAGGCNYYLGDFKVTGDLAETDTGVLGLSIASGAVRISGNNEDGKGVAIGTEVVFSPSLNGRMICKARVQAVALTTRNFFIGFCDVNADDVAEPLTATGTTLTLTASDICGFTLDSQLTAATEWHMVHNGGSTAGQTDSEQVVSDVTAVAAEWDVLRVEIDENGKGYWFINDVLKQTVAGASSTTVLLAAYVGCWGTTGTVADLDCDYLGVEAGRDWTR